MRVINKLKRKILVVEDQAGIRLLLTDALANIGYCVKVAETGKEGLEKINRDSFDLIILDYQLPFMNGIEMISIMEEKQINIPIIMMSGYIESIKKEKFQEGSVVKWIAKPFNIQEVCEIVRKILKD